MRQPAQATESVRTEAQAAVLGTSSRFKRPKPHPQHAGTVQCLCCGGSFVSWDRTRNRLCAACARRG